MKIEVLLFGGAAEATGADRVRVDVPEPYTCAVVMKRLREADPRLGRFVEAGRLAVNHAFAEPERVIVSGEEVALISLVSGG